MADILTGATCTIDARDGIARSDSPLPRVASKWRFIACVQAADFVIFFAAALYWITTLSEHSFPLRLPLLLVAATLAAVTVYCVSGCYRLYEFGILIDARYSAAKAFLVGLGWIGLFLPPLLLRPGGTTDVLANCLLFIAVPISVAVVHTVFGRLATGLRRAGVVGARIFIVADSVSAASALAAQLDRMPDNRVVGTWSLPQDDRPDELLLDGALNFLRERSVDAVVLKLSPSQPDRIMQTARILRSFPYTVLLALNLDGSSGVLQPNEMPHLVRTDGLENLVLLKVSDRPLDGWRWLTKDLLDRTLALLLVILVSPVLLAAAIAVKLSDPGPVLFYQSRRGYGGNVFSIMKFRTMRVADDSAGFSLTARNDSRIFPVGQILRKTSMDELPQLFNVLKGDMWLIGPRPHPLFAQAGGIIYPEAVAGYVARYRIKPGITGWAQVCGWRGPTETVEQLRMRVEHDLYYIDNWSVSFDLVILLKTLTCVFGHQNAF